ncbi:MAG: serine protease [Bacteroidales bacterium]|nr:serine protease [Bacteroidales bacterium]
MLTLKSICWKKYHNHLWLFVFVCVLLFSCSRRTLQMVYPTLNDGKYDSEFPYRACSDQLLVISQSVKKLNTYADYSMYYFSENHKVKRSDIHKTEILQKAIQVSRSNESLSGTATVIQSDDGHVALLTCAHIVNFPDTIVSYFENKEQSEKYVYSLAIKTSYIIFVRDFPERANLEILAMDTEEDIAILGQKIQQKDRKIPVFSYPLGHSKSLEWGSFVYVMGYPMGYPMITKGIVSNPDYDNKGSFLIDAILNTGFSGGVVMAIKDGVPNFELVGLGRSVSATHEYFLKPAHQRHEIVYNPYLPYEEEIFVGIRRDINYGITHVISTEKLKRFYQQNKKQLYEKGFDLSGFFEH